MLFTNHESPNTALLTSDLCQELGREASERRTALPLSKDGFMIWDDGRRTGFRSYQTLDPKPQTRSSPSTNHYSLITSHGSQEHTPRRQEHAATPLERGSQIKSGLAAFDSSLGGWTCFRSSGLWSSPRTWTRSVGTKNLGATRRNRSLALSKDGFMIWDDGRWTGFRSSDLSPQVLQGV